jgi:hypothetical protein
MESFSLGQFYPPSHDIIPEVSGTSYTFIYYCIQAFQRYLGDLVP